MSFLRRDRSRGPDPWLNVKIGLFFLAAVTAGIGIATDTTWLVSVATGVLVVALLLRFFERSSLRNRTDTDVVGGGTFHCPACEDDRRYDLIVETRRRTLLGIPIGPATETARQVRCTVCGTSFDRDVLYSDDERFARRVEAVLREGLRGLIVRMVVEDGRVEAEERAILNRVHEDLLGGRLEADELDAEIREATADTRPAADYARAIAGYLDDDARRTVLRAAIRVAAADGELHPAERNLVTEIGTALELEPSEIAAALDRVRT